MKEKKNIERLFQEKFKDFEVLPPQDAWQNIENRLQNKKKKRRVIPFWLNPTGIAAGIVLLFGLYNIFNQKNNFIEIPWNGNFNDKVVKQTNDDLIKVDKNNNSSFQNDVYSPDGLNKIIDKNEVVTEQNSTKDNSDYNSKNNYNNRINNKNILVFENKPKASTKDESQNKFGNDLLISNQNLIGGLNEKNGVDSSKGNIKKANSKKDFLVDIENEIDFNKTGIDELISKNEIVSNNASNNKIENVSNNLKEGTAFNTVIIDTLKINQALANNLEVLDSTELVNISEEKNELEELLKEKDEGENADEKEKEKRNRWAVSTNAAPIYFNSFAEGSPLDEQFATNEKSFKNSISYGVGVAYNLSNKFTIRTGVNRLGVSYDTHEVYYSNLIKSNMANVNLRTLHVDRVEEAKDMNFFSKREANVFGDVENFTSGEEGTLNQQLGYIEVPVEMNYKLLDKRFGIDVIGGMSTLFLQENSVFLESNGLQMKIGEANNLNSIHFSGNVGLGFRYSFWKSFNANFQPMLKYQFNAFSENSGNFKPYIVGLYTGLSFNF